MWAFRGLIVLKKCLTFFLLIVRKPVFWLWNALLYPILVIGYRICRFVKRSISAQLEAHERITGLFTHRYIVKAAVLVLTFLVTATNIYAGESAPKPEDASSQQSLLARLTGNPEEDVLVEEAPLDAEPGVEDVSYLNDQAISSQDYYNTNGAAEQPADQQSLAETPEEEAVSPINAVRSLPESTGDQAQPMTRTQIVEYVVQNGDNIGSIAAAFGLLPGTVLTANNLGPRSVIREGQKLRILPVDGVVYKTKRGDTLTKIAKTYKSEAAKIIEMNGLADSDSLDAGIELVLPDGKLPPPPPAPTRSFANFPVPPPAADRVGLGQLLWPCGSRRITQYYKRKHTGLDIGAPIGTPIYAADSGVVVYAGWNSGGYGNMTIVDHGGGLYTRYGHASKLLTKVGQRVQRGDVIALVGSTGRSTGPHLHFEVMTGTYTNRHNPLDYVK